MNRQKRPKSHFRHICLLSQCWHYWLFTLPMTKPLTLHLTDVHSVDPSPYRCPQCWLLTLHLTDVHSVDLSPYRCPQCWVLTLHLTIPMSASLAKPSFLIYIGYSQDFLFKYDIKHVSSSSMELDWVAESLTGSRSTDRNQDPDPRIRISSSDPRIRHNLLVFTPSFISTPSS